MGPLLSFVRVNWRAYWATIGFLCDVTLVLVVMALSFALANALSGTPWQSLTHPGHLLAGILIVIGAFASVGIYRRISEITWNEHGLLATKAFIAATFLWSLILFSGGEHERHYNVLAAWCVIFPVLYGITWQVLRGWMNTLRKNGHGALRTLLIESLDEDNRALPVAIPREHSRYDVVGVIQTGEMHADEHHTEGITHLLRSGNVEHIVVTAPRLNGEFKALRRLCQKYGVGLSFVSPEVDSLFATAGLQPHACLSISFDKAMVSGNKALKRVFDVVVSSVLLVLLAPLFLAIAVALKIESRGPVFFRQKRSLSDIDQAFEFLKFRSMRENAEGEKAGLVSSNESDGPLFKMKDDPRLTRVGRYLRRYSLDELPQLVNVWRGEMTLVGPRPLPVSDFSLLKYDAGFAEYFRHRVRTKPGMTGLWQISGRSNLGFREMVLLDLYYIENRSLLFDFEILFQTIPVVLLGKGAY